MTRYGFLGLGIMGQAMAANLVRAGLDVMVWNRTAEKCRSMAELGAHQGESPAAVVAACDVTFAMLADPTAAEAVCFGPDGVLAGLAPGKAYVDISTVDPQTATRIDRAVTERGGRFLEAPVSGSRKPAEEGTLVFLCAGEEALFREVEPVLGKMGKHLHFLGATGQGARMKLVVNMIMGTMLTGFAEGLALAGKAGLAPADLLAVLDEGALANPLFRLKGPAMAEGRFATAFPLKHMQKDLRLALQLGDEVAQPLSAAAAANAAYIRARAAGCAEEDFSAVLKVIEG